MVLKKNLLSVVIFAAANTFAANVWDGTVATAFANGSGTKASPYQISNGAELALFAQKVNQGDTTLSAVLTEDIYLNEDSENYAEWGEKAPANAWPDPIGSKAHRFQGSVDGKGHRIYGAYQTRELVDLWNGFGFFGVVGDSAVIKNLGVENSYVSMSAEIDGKVVTTNPHVAVFAGWVSGGHFSNISASGLVKVDTKVLATSGTYFAENGCIAGFMAKRSVVVNAFANCRIESAAEKTSGVVFNHSLGGVIGKLGGTTFIENVYAKSSVKNTSAMSTDGEYFGGVIGHIDNKTDTVYNAYYDISVIGSENAPTAALGESAAVTKNVASKTSSKMKSEEFASLLGPAFTYTASKNGGYPQPVVFEGAAAFDGGNGTEASPYLIGSAKALRAVSGLVNGMNAEFGDKHYKMTADVELNEDSETYKSWETTPPEFSWFQIGREYHRKDTVSADCGATKGVFGAKTCSSNAFAGTFDGAHHSVKGLYISDTTNQSQGGLFYITDNATIKNLGVTHSYVSVKGRAAGIVGIAGYTVIDSCSNSAEIRSVSQDNGGIAGVMFNSKILNSFNTGNIKTTSNKRPAWSNAGIVGEMFRTSEVVNSWNAGDIVGVQTNAGGIVGYCDSSKVINVYNRGSVSSDSVTGGIAGVLRISSTMKGAYSTGTVSSKAAKKRGGLIGQMAEQSSPKVRNIVSDCYYNSQTIGTSNAPTAAIGTTAGTVTNTSALPTATMTTGRFAIMLGNAYKQDDAVNDGYPTFLAEGETYGVKDIFAGGDGSEENPFLIATATQLRNMEYLVNKKNGEYGASHYKLTADIVLNDNTDKYTTWATTAPANVWTPMGTDSTKSFKGVFDGGNFSISGIYTNAKFSGLFGAIGAEAVVKNLTIKESLAKTTSATGMVGMLAGYNKGRVHNVHNEGNVYANMTTAGSYVLGAGLIGFNNEGTVDSCSNAGSVDVLGNSKGNNVFVGGVVGKDLRGTLDALTNSGAVSGRSQSNNNVAGKVYTGGVVGYSAHTLITNAKNEGKVVSKANDSGVKAQAWVRIGGILGADSISSSVKWCVNTGDVEGTVTSLFDTDHSVVNGGGIVGDQLTGPSYIGYCRNEGNVTANASYANARSEIGGILGWNRGGIVIEYCYTKGIISATTKATSSPKSVMGHAGGIAGCLNAAGVVRGSFSYANVKSTVSPSGTNRIGGIVANNAGTIVGSYFDKTVAGTSNVTGNNTGTLTKALALTTEEMQTNEFAWKLNTAGGDSANSGAFTRYNSYPEFADSDHLPIYRIVFDDYVNIENRYTSYRGYVQAPANPEPAPGEQFVGWTDGDKYMLQNRQVIDKDMTLYALFTLVTEPIYFITFVDGNEIYVKATETTGMLKTLPVAKNIPMGYEFNGWYDQVTDKEITKETIFTGTATVVAKYTAILYKITFLDYDNTELSNKEVAYGTMPTAPKNPSREPSETYSYQFARWSPEVAIVSGEASYIAVYDSTEISLSSASETGSSESVGSSASTETGSSESVGSSASTETGSSESVGSSESTETGSSESVGGSSASTETGSSESVGGSSASTETGSSESVGSSSASTETGSSESVGSSSESSEIASSSSKGKSNSSDSSKPKSSSSKDKSDSSDSSKPKSSSSKDKNDIRTIAVQPQFSLYVAGRSIQVANAHVGSKYAVLDMQGRVILQGVVHSENFNIGMNKAASYIVRIGNQMRVARIK